MIRWWTFRALGLSTAPILNASLLTKGVSIQLMISDMLNASKYVFTKQAFLRYPAQEKEPSLSCFDSLYWVFHLLLL